MEEGQVGQISQVNVESSRIFPSPKLNFFFCPAFLFIFCLQLAAWQHRRVIELGAQGGVASYNVKCGKPTLKTSTSTCFIKVDVEAITSCKSNLANLGQIAQHWQHQSHPSNSRHERLSQAAAMAAMDCGGALVACPIDHCGTLTVHDSRA